MADDDLSSFFAEIDQAVAEVGPSEQPSVIVSAPVVSAKPQIISKPAELSSRGNIPEQIVSTSVSNHPVYTYVAPELPYGAEQNPYSSYDSTSQFSTSYQTTTTFKAPLPPAVVAPPQVPRQDKIFVRKAADETWVDETLQEWPDNDYRIFVGDIAKEVSTEMLAKQFQHYASYAKAKVCFSFVCAVTFDRSAVTFVCAVTLVFSYVLGLYLRILCGFSILSCDPQITLSPPLYPQVIRTKAENKARGFGFVSFLDPMDCAKAIREMNGKYLASRCVRVLCVVCYFLCVYMYFV